MGLRGLISIGMAVLAGLALPPAASAQPAGAPSQGFAKQESFGTLTAGGKVHYDQAVLAKRGVSPAYIAQAASDILAFQQQAWGESPPLFWDIYVKETRKDGAGNLGSTTYSATQNVAGATFPGPKACVLLLSLANIEKYRIAALDFQAMLAYTMAHEATHCFQRAISKTQNETVAYSHADWFMEGSANWLAGSFIEARGHDYPDFLLDRFRKRHRDGLLASKGEWHFLFKWLEGRQGLRSREPVMQWVRAMLDAPWDPCVERLPVTVIADERVYPDNDDHCEGATSPYEKSMPAWFEGRRYKLREILAIFGSAVARGTVPGIKDGSAFIEDRNFALVFEDYVARVSAWAIDPSARAPLASFTVNPGDRPIKPFGFASYRFVPGGAILPAPAAYFWAVEKPHDKAYVLLSKKSADDTLNDEGWIATDTLDDQWVTVSATATGAGQGSKLLLTYLSAPSRPGP